MESNREKTNSVTHLVKIIAEEVYDKKMEELKKDLFNSHVSLQTVYQEHVENITSSLKEAGQKWTQEEDDLLLVEIRTAVAQIAKNHSRSRGAITSRIRQKQILYLD